MDSLIAELERATEGSRALDQTIHRFVVPEEYTIRNSPLGWPCYTTSFDVALTLLPDTACNQHLASFSGHGVEIDGFPETAWCFGFADTAQLMGERAAKEEIERMSRDWPFGGLAEPPRVWLEKAIAEHFIEFNCQCAATPALAVDIASLKARQAMKDAA